LGLFEAINGRISIITFGFGWPFMVTGFSLVLLSRLHLVVHSPKLLRFLLAVVIVDAMLVQFPVFIFSFIGAPQSVIFLKVVRFLSHFEVIFAVQEVRLSSLHIYFFIRFVKQGGSKVLRSLKRTSYLLITAESIIIVCDLTVNILLYLNLYIPRKIILPFIHAVKLQIEFLVLNRLISSRQWMDVQLQDHEADVGIRNAPLDNSRGSTQPSGLSDRNSSPLDSTEKYTESCGPVLTIGSLGHGREQRYKSRQVVVLFPPLCFTCGEVGRGDMDTIEELERRYLVRFGGDKAV
jgi:hypothetical protein